MIAFYGLSISCYAHAQEESIQEEESEHLEVVRPQRDTAPLLADAGLSDSVVPTQPKPAGLYDPFANLKVVIPEEQLGPIRSVRARDEQEAQDLSKAEMISVMVGTQPKGAPVTYGGKLLGITPFTMNVHRGSTPLDVVIHFKGKMTLRTRLNRKETRTYFFKLSPAKLQ